MLAIVILCAAAVLAGVVVLGIGWRGRVIDDHPLCRKCGFDLFGRPAGSERCGECGAMLTGPRAIRIGHRQRRGRMLFVAVALLLPAAMILSGLGWATARGIELYPYEPVWLLLRQADELKGGAMNELIARLVTKKLSDGQLRSIVDHALAVQADATQSWNSQWMHFLDAAYTAGVMSDAQWQKLWEQTWSVHLLARPTVSRDHPRIAIAAEAQPTRVGTAGDMRFTLWWRTRIVNLKVAGIPCDGSRFDRNSRLNVMGTKGAGGEPIVVELPADKLASLKDSWQIATGDVEISVYDPVSTQWIIATSKLTASTPWQLLPADQPTVKLVHDPAQSAAMQNAFTIKSLKFDPKSWNGFVLDMQGNSPPVMLISRMIIRNKQKEWPGNVITFSTRTGGGGGYIIKATEFTGDTVDVILRPDVNAAADTLNVDAIWGDEIIFKNVKVTRGE